MGLFLALWEVEAISGRQGPVAETWTGTATGTRTGNEIQKRGSKNLDNIPVIRPYPEWL